MMHPSTSVLMVEQGPQNGCHQRLSLREVQVASCLSQKLSKISSWVCPRLLSKHVRFLCAPFKSRISVICSPVCSPVCKPYWPSKADFLGACLPVQQPQAREPDMELGLPAPWGTSAVAIVLHLQFTYLWVWVLTILCFCPFNLSCMVPSLCIKQ